MCSFLDRIGIQLLDSNIQEIESCFQFVRACIRPEMPESEVLKVIDAQISSGDYERLTKGLVYGMLAGLDWGKFLFVGNADVLHSACVCLASLVPALRTRNTGIELFMRLWQTDCSGFNDVFLTFVRTYDLIYEIRSEMEWVNNSAFVSLVFYKVVRQTTVAVSEGNVALSEYSYVIVQLWRNRRESCLSIGRDLMRVISPLSEVNGLELIWNDLFSPSRDGSPLYWSLLCTPSHPRYHSVLLNPTLEAKLVYVIENATVYNYTRYLKWIIDEYEEAIIADIVRFILTFPTSSESTPRWQIIAWLLSCTNDHQLQANIKQALVFDCLFYNQLDQVYTIEPLMSLLKFSLARCPQLTEEILEFLLSSAELYDKRSVAGMMRSLKECFNIAYYNRLIPPLESLISDERIDSTIRTRLSELLDSSCNSSEPSQSPIPDDETPPNTPRSYELIGNDFAIDPSFDKLSQILDKATPSKDLASYITKCISHEFLLPIVPDLQRNSIVSQIFLKAENDDRYLELLKSMASAESAVGIRLLIYSLQAKSGLYFKLDTNLEKDLKICTDETAAETLNWIFPFLLHRQKFTPQILLQFLAIATSEVLFHTELDLRSGKYKLLSPMLDELLPLSMTLSSIEKVYLWRLLAAEISINKLGVLIEFSTKNYCAENWSGVIEYFRVNCLSIEKEHVQMMVGLPLHLCSTVAVVLRIVSSEAVESAVLGLLSPLNFTCLAHLKYWVKNKLSLCSIVYGNSVQEGLVRALQTLSTDTIEEFNCLLDDSRKLYTFQ